MIVTVDIESYYDTDYSLSKLSTEAYIRDPRFEVIGVGIAIGNHPTYWYTGDDVATAINAVNWDDVALLCWNTTFDGAILAWKYGKYPRLYLDAMGAARAVGLAYDGASLDAVATATGVGKKGTYVVSAKGKRRADFAPHELATYGQYCITDVDLTRSIYQQLKPKFVMSEVMVQDLMLRMFIDPLLLFDTPALHAYHQYVVENKATALRRCAEKFNTTEEVLLKQLMSNPKFAEMLRTVGIEPPTKISPTTGLEAYAFAKTDQDFVALQEHEDETVATLVQTRLGVKTTIEETRSQKFMDIAVKGAWPVQYNYWAAISSRFTGGGGANPQNLKRGGKLRDAVLPPPGHKLVVGDLSQIEARMVNYVACQDNVVEVFRAFDNGTGPDVYCVAANKIFGKPITKEEFPRERTIGKIAELSCGYGASGVAYKKMCFSQAGLIVPIQECNRVVDVYRRTHQKVQELWYQGDDVLSALVRGVTFRFGKHGVLDGSNPTEGIGLPNGMYVRLPKLEKRFDPKKGSTGYFYKHRKKTYEIYGAMLVADCIQALARIIMTEAMIRIVQYGWRCVMTTHDELVFVVPDADVNDALSIVQLEMTRPLTWAPGLPLACSVGAGANYGEAK